MDNRKTDDYYLRRAETDLEFILKHTEGISKEKLESDEVLVDSVMFRLMQVSESLNKLSQSFKEKYDQIPWQLIKGLRNRIVHQYNTVDLTIVYETVKVDIPKLLSDIKNCLVENYGEIEKIK